MAKFSQYDGLFFGALLGLVLAYPSLATNIGGFIKDLLPNSWDWFGSSTKSILVIALGAIVGWLVDKTGK